MRFPIALLITAILCFWAADGIQASVNETESWMPDCQYLNSDKMNKVQAGQLLCILLSENPTTPYWWAWESSNDTLIEAVTDKYMPDDNPQQADGVGGRHAFYFRATRAGTCSIDMCLVPLGEVDESASQIITYQMAIEEAESAKETGPFPVNIKAWMETVADTLKNIGLCEHTSFTFLQPNGRLCVYMLALEYAPVTVNLFVTTDMRPISIQIEMDYGKREFSEGERLDAVARMQSALMACMAATDPTLNAARAEEIAVILSEWVWTALSRGVNMGHDEREGNFYYCAMNDVAQRSAAFYISDYPIYGGPFFDGMDTGSLELEDTPEDGENADEGC